MKLELSIIISQILAFLIMLAILKKFAWKPILKILKERQEKIQAEFDLIEKKKKEARELADQYSAKLEDIDRQSKQKMNEAIEEGRRLARQIQEQMQAEGRALLIKAHEDIEKEMLKAQEQLKSRVVDLVLLATQKILTEKMDSAQDRKMVETILNVHK